MRIKFKYLAMSCIASLLLVAACKKKEKIEVVEVPTVPGKPAVVTLAVDSLSSTEVVLHGQVTREGNGEVAAVGFCWSDTKVPTVDDTPTSLQFPAGRFRYRLTGLKPGTSYSFKAYARNENGIGYGDAVSFQAMKGWSKVAVSTPGLPSLSDLLSTGTRLIGSAGNKAYVSADNGLTWTASNNMLASIQCFANMGEIIFAGMSSGASLSNNGGTIWVPASNGLPNTAISDLHVHGTTVFAYSGGYFYKTVNNGQQWTATSYTNNVSGVSGMASVGNTLVLTNGNAIYQSQDNGTNWSFTAQAPYMSFGRLKATENALLGVAYQRLYRSKDLGNTWTEVTLPMGFSNVATSGNYVAVYSGNVYSGVFISKDGGQTFVRNDGGLEGSYFYGMVIHKNSIMATTNTGLYKLPLD